MRQGLRGLRLPGDGRRPGRGRRLRPRGAGAVQRPRRRARPRPSVEPGEWAGQVWYPLWDSGANIDHSVRTVDEALDQAAADLRVATGMLDARHLAGDPNLTLRLRSAVLNQWRRDARTRLGELHELVSERGRLTGELADASVPDLKESVGGLRDATVLKALVASWLVDVPHGDLERCRMALLDVRDALHTVAGRATDRVAPEYWQDVAPIARARGRHRRAALHPRRWRAGSPTCPASPGAGPRPSSGAPARPGRAARGWSGSRPGSRSRTRRSCSTRTPVPPRTRCSCCGPPPRPPSATWCWRRRRPPGWCARASRWRTRGRRVRATCWCGCSPPDPGCSGCGRPSTRPARWSWCCRSGSGSGCCRTPPSCTGSPSTGTSWRPASRRPR